MSIDITALSAILQHQLFSLASDSDGSLVFVKLEAFQELICAYDNTTLEANKVELLQKRVSEVMLEYGSAVMLECGRDDLENFAAHYGLLGAIAESQRGAIILDSKLLEMVPNLAKLKVVIKDINKIDECALALYEVVDFKLIYLKGYKQPTKQDMKDDKRRLAAAGASILEEASSKLDHDYFMAEALNEAQKAAELGEVPVGAVIVNDAGEILGRGHNLTITTHDISAHAEIVAMRDASKKLGNYRLGELTLYVTLEPCCMCAMALIHARIKNVIFGARDDKTGACGSVFNLMTDPKHNHLPYVVAGISKEKCAQVLKKFFALRR